MIVKTLLVFLLSLLGNHQLFAQPKTDQYTLFLDTVSSGGICQKSCKELHVFGADNEVTDFTIVKTDLFITATSKFYSVASSEISDEMRLALDQLDSGTQITFKATAINPRNKKITITGVFYVE